jgi:hypothetical protein
MILHFIGYALILYSMVMVVAFNTTENNIFTIISVASYLLGCYEMFLQPYEEVEEEFYVN